MDVVLPEDLDFSPRGEKSGSWLGSWVRNNNKLKSFVAIPCGIRARHHHSVGDECNGPAFDNNTTHSYPLLTTVKPLLSEPQLNGHPLLSGH